MPLRPVSELGLVDITDVPARSNRTATRGDSTQRKRDAGGRAGTRGAAGTPKRGSTAPATAGRSGGKSNRARSRTATNVGNTSERPSARKQRNVPGSDQIKVVLAQEGVSSKSRGMSASTTSSERSRGRSKAASGSRSGGANRSATTRTPKRPNGPVDRTRGATTARRQTSAASRPKRNTAARDGHRSRNGPRPDHAKPSSATKLGIYALAGASLVAGGLLLARAALHR